MVLVTSRRSIQSGDQSPHSKLTDIQKFVEIEESQCELGQRLIIEKLGRLLKFIRGRCAAECQSEGSVDDLVAIVAAFPFQALRERLSQVIR